MTSQNDVQSRLANRYELKQLLGWGAHGEVYKAYDIELKITVAIKIFFSQREGALRYLNKELKAISKLSHPNILALRDFGEAKWKGQDINYIVTPFIEGGNLALRIKNEGPLSINKAVDIAIQLAQALSYMHQKKHLHKDIKPANILIDGQGNVVLADFSIAADMKSIPTGPMGTPEYCAPEQMNSPYKNHPRIDVYGLGMTVYECLVGINPIREITKTQGQAAALQNKYFDEITPLHEKDKKIPYGLSLAIKKMLASDKKERYQNMEEVVQALVPYANPDADMFGETIVPESEEEKEKETSKFQYSSLRIWRYLQDQFEKTASLLPLIKQYVINFFQKVSEKEEIERLFRKAQELKRKGKWKENLKIYRQILFLDSHHYRALNHQGDVLMKLKRYKEALKSFDRAILQNPKYYSAYCHRGYAYINLGDSERAMQDYDLAVLIDGNKPQAYYYRATAWLKLCCKKLYNGDLIGASKAYQNMHLDIVLAKEKMRGETISETATQ